jgi:hypothetical protein
MLDCQMKEVAHVMAIHAKMVISIVYVGLRQYPIQIDASQQLPIAINAQLENTEMDVVVIKKKYFMEHILSFQQKLILGFVQLECVLLVPKDLCALSVFFQFSRHHAQLTPIKILQDRHHVSAHYAKGANTMQIM